jgi:2-dehydropantoate 2-reductase
LNIVVFGAGAIGSLFGGLLSQNNKVVLIGRKKHVDIINSKGLKIQDKTKLNVKIKAFENIENIDFSPDLIIISVKSFDTEKVAKQIKKFVSKKTFIMSLQNGLDNIEKISKYVDKNKILVCITTHGAIFSKPGVVKHTGIGKTHIGSIEDDNVKNVEDIVDLFNKAGIKADISQNIVRDIWIKGIINSSINTLTAIFECKNGYLLENPVLERFVEIICKESTSVANACDLNLRYEEMVCKTKEVINDTKDNYSSMYQSVKKGNSTEIESINGVLVRQAKEKNISVFLNEILINCIK